MVFEQIKIVIDIFVKNFDYFNIGIGVKIVVGLMGIFSFFGGEDNGENFGNIGVLWFDFGFFIVFKFF